MPGGPRTQRGLALLEALTTTVLVGTLAATALPRLVELNGDARATTLKGVAAAATSTMYANHAACLVAASGRAAVRCVAVRDCADVAALMVGGLPAGYAVEARSLQGSARGNDATSCTLSDSETGRSVAFSGLATAS